MSIVSPEMARDYTELLEILRWLPEEERERIPEDDIAFYERHKDPDHHFTIDPAVPLSQQNISRGAFAHFVNLYREYIATPEERADVDKILDRNDRIADMKAIRARHSVRQFKEMAISDKHREALEELIGRCNEESGLHMQLITDDPECFDSFLAKYGQFRNARNYIAIVGPRRLQDLDERAGYYGQKVVIAAQRMGLNTCWVAGTYRRGKCKVDKDADEKIVCVIAIGYGENQGVRHRSKPLGRLCDVAEPDMPGWFRNGVKAAMMAPTAMNQQRFHISLKGKDVVITADAGPMTMIDLGIVKCNFEAASGYKFNV